MKNAVIITTTYQLFNALNLSTSVNTLEDTDLFILDLGRNVLERMDRPYLDTLFHKVYVLSPRSYTGVKKAAYFLLSTAGKKLFSCEVPERYDAVYLTGVETYSKLVAMSILRRGGSLFYLEDGTGSYSIALDPNYRKKNDIVLQLRYGRRPISLVRGSYVYVPELVTANPLNIPVRQLPKIGPDSFGGVDLLRVFNGKKLEFPCPFVYLNSWSAAPEMYALQRQFIDIMKEEVGAEHCSVKLHPNETQANNRIDYGVQTIGIDGSMEVTNFYKDFGSMVFISTASTASLTPKWLYDQEPVVIMLYRLVDHANHIDRPVEGDERARFRGMYTDPSRFIIPDSLDEYREVLRALKRRYVK